MTKKTLAALGAAAPLAGATVIALTAGAETETPAYMVEDAQAIALGADAAQALARLRAVRPCAVETAAQLAWAENPPPIFRA